jgi:hypothetical protein
MCSLQEFLRNLSVVHELSEVERSVTHPLHTLIHRRVPVASSVEEPRRKLLSARIPIEITAENRNTLLAMNDLQGISCSCHCVYGGQVRAGCIPLYALDDYIMNGTVTEGEKSIFIADYAYGKIKCFHREVTSFQENFTVLDALQARGKDDRCLIDSNFSLFFNNQEHDLIWLRNQLDLNRNPAAATIDSDQVIFNDPFFDFSAWSQCPTIFVKLPYAAMKCLMAGKNLDKEIRKKHLEEHRRALELLHAAFLMSDIETNEATAINALLDKALMCDNLVNDLTLEERELILQHIERYFDGFYHEPLHSYFQEVLEPYLLSHAATAR